MNSTTNGQTTTILSPTPQRKFPWKIVLPILFLLMVSFVGLIASSFLKRPGPQQGTISRAGSGAIEVSSWDNNCSSTSVAPSDSSCKGNIAKVHVILKNNSGTDQNISVRRQQFSCNFGKQGTSSCGQNAKDNNSPVTVPASSMKDLGTLESSTPESNCGSAQADIFVTNTDGAILGPFWGFAWTGSDCSTSPTHTPTPIPATPTPIFTPTAGASVTPSPTPSPTPTVTITPAPMCSSINFYSVDLTINPPNLFVKQIAPSDLSSLKPGDKINITVIGNSDTVKGQVRVNGDNWHDLLQKRQVSGSNNFEFYDSNAPGLFLIPTNGVTAFKVEGRSQ